jgi:hypothetical protein
MAYAIENMGWKFYFINAAWDFVFLVIAYFTFVETKGFTLEGIAENFEGKTNMILGVEEESRSGEIETEHNKQDGVVRRLGKFEK